MFTRFALPLTVSALALSGCLTTQENPNYQHSTRYQGANPQGDVMPQAIQNARVETIQMPVSQTQTTAVVYEQAPAPIVTSTDSTYTVETVTGTPGYMAMQSGQATVVLSDANGVSTPVVVEYDYTPNLITAGTQMPAGQPAALPNVTRTYGATSHTVVAGDTVYSLARQRCVPLADITSVNGIGADFAIRLGQVLQLPAPRC